MIKVGDYIKFNNKIDRVEEIVPTPNDKYMIYFENIDHGVLFDGLYESRIVDYKQLYEQQKLRADELEKQNDILKHNIRVELDSSRNMYIGMCEQKHRADRAEKRWSELKEHFNKEKEQSFGILSWSRNNGMLELMEQLEEDGE
ncbi:hypothetical protein ETI06_05755 [Macrococcoides goetzii]|nr:hypothetical protein [Macrococcus goetzii]TDM49978.1 hypothetical protein ETI06_05755 [Macrococcus goetzii]